MCAHVPVWIDAPLPPAPTKVVRHLVLACSECGGVWGVTVNPRAGDGDDVDETIMAND